MTDPIHFDPTAAKWFPRFRVYTRKGNGVEWVKRRMFAQWSLNTDPAFDEPITGIPTNKDTSSYLPGFIVDHASRALFPGIGQAILRVPYGNINGDITTLGTDWDLTGHQIRIDCLKDGATDLSVDASFLTIFWGVIERQSDSRPAAHSPVDSNIQPSDAESAPTPRIQPPASMRTFIAYDPLYHLSKRPITSHRYENGLTSATGVIRTCYGPMGFNVDSGGGRAPNMGYTGITATVYPHCMAGATFAAYWPDRNVVDTVLAEADLVVPVSVSDPKNMLLQAIGSWPVNDGDTAHNVLSMVLDRSRGLGCAFFDWDGDLVGQSTPGLIRVYPQTVDDIVVPKIADGADTNTEMTIPGASNTSPAATTLELIFTGNHYLDSASFMLGDEHELTYDRVETWGERIRVLATLSVPGGDLVQGWSAAQETAFDAAADADEANLPEFDAVYRVLRIAGDWSCATTVEVPVYGPTIPATVRLDYRCSDSGVIVKPTATDPQDTSPGSIQITAAWPCPSDVDPLDGTALTGQPSTGQAVRFRFFKRTGDNAVEDWIPTTDKVNPNNGPQTLIFTAQDRTKDGKTRPFSSTWESLLATVGIILPHRVMLGTTGPTAENPPRRVQRIRVPGAHLWLGHRNTIVGIDSGTTPKRIGVSSVPIYRDDRAMLRQRHALASQWYLNERRTLQYTMRDCCGLLQTFDDANATQKWARLGYVITTADIAGESVTINTVVSRISYDNGNTTVVTDWMDLR